MKKFFMIFGFTVLGVLVVLVLVGGYYGFVPGVANIFGSNKPKDLGVTYTEQDRLDGRAKIGWTINTLSPGLPPEQSLVYTGSKAVDASFTEKELTAWINKSWNYAPLTNCQIRVNPDNSVEFSGILHINRIKDYETAMGGNATDFDKLLPGFVKYLPSSPPVYMKASASVVNNQVSCTIQAFSIGRYSFSSDWLEKNSSLFENAAEWQISRIPGVSVNSITFSNGQVQFDGTLPASISRTVQ
jgi:hypothetical protein